MSHQASYSRTASAATAALGRHGATATAALGRHGATATAAAAGFTDGGEGGEGGGEGGEGGGGLLGGAGSGRVAYTEILRFLLAHLAGWEQRDAQVNEWVRQEN